MPVVVKTIKPLGGGDYTTLADFESARKTANGWWWAECYDGNLGPNTIIGDTAGRTASNTEYTKVYAASNQYPYIDVTNSSFGIRIENNYTRIVGINFRANGTIGNVEGIVIAGSDEKEGIQIDSCVFERWLGTFTSCISATTTLEDTCIIKLNRIFRCMRSNSIAISISNTALSQVGIYRNTVIGNGEGQSPSGTGFYLANYAGEFFNNISLGFTTAYNDVEETANAGYNVSSTDTTLGTDGIVDAVDSELFQDHRWVDLLYPTATSDLFEAGIDEDSITTDPFGTAFPATPDIGALSSSNIPTIKDIKPDGTGDYTTLAAFETARQGANAVWWARCYNGDIGSRVTIQSGGTPSRYNKIRIYPGPGQHPRMEISTQTGQSANPFGLTLIHSNVSVEGITFRLIGDGAVLGSKAIIADLAGSSTIRGLNIDSCIFDITATGTYDIWNTTIDVRDITSIDCRISRNRFINKGDNTATTKVIAFSATTGTDYLKIYSNSLLYPQVFGGGARTFIWSGNIDTVFGGEIHNNCVIGFTYNSNFLYSFDSNNALISYNAYTATNTVGTNHISGRTSTVYAESALHGDLTPVADIVGTGIVCGHTADATGVPYVINATTNRSDIGALSSGRFDVTIAGNPVTKIVDPAGNGDFDTLADFEVARRSAYEVWWAECQTGDCGPVEIYGGGTPSASRYVRIYSGAGEDAAIEVTTGETAISVKRLYTQIDFMTIRATASTGTIIGVKFDTFDAITAQIGAVVDSCIFEATTGNSFTNSIQTNLPLDSTSQFIRNRVIDCTRASNRAFSFTGGPASVPDVAHNSLYGSDVSTTTGMYFATFAGEIRNNISVGFTIPYDFVSGGLNASNNISSSGTTLGGDGGLINIVATDVYESPSTGDLRPKDGGPAVQNGMEFGIVFDATDSVFPLPPDIGALSSFVLDSSSSSSEYTPPQPTANNPGNSYIGKTVLSTNTVDTSAIIDSSATTSKFRDGAVTADKLADYAITSEKLIDTIAGPGLHQLPLEQLSSYVGESLYSIKVNTDEITTTIIDNDVLSVKEISGSHIKNRNITSSKLAPDMQLGGNLTTTDDVNVSNLVEGSGWNVTQNISVGDTTTAGEEVITNNVEITGGGLSFEDSEITQTVPFIGFTQQTPLMVRAYIAFEFTPTNDSDYWTVNNGGVFTAKNLTHLYTGSDTQSRIPYTPIITTLNSDTLVRIYPETYTSGTPSPSNHKIIGKINVKKWMGIKEFRQTGSGEYRISFYSASDENPDYPNDVFSDPDYVMVGSCEVDGKGTANNLAATYSGDVPLLTMIAPTVHIKTDWQRRPGINVYQSTQNYPDGTSENLRVVRSTTSVRVVTSQRCNPWYVTLCFFGR